jgi:hypothetical protein
MENPPVSKYTTSFGISLAVCAVLNAVIVMVKEKSGAVNGWMQSLTGNHWLTHVAMVAGVFVVLGVFLARLQGGQGPRVTVVQLTKLVLAGTIIGVGLVLGFYLAVG